MPKNKYFLTFSLTFILMFITCFIYAGPMSFNNHKISADSSSINLKTLSPESPFFVTCDNLQPAETIKILTQSGCNILAFIPDSYFLAAAKTPERVRQLAENKHVKIFSLLEPEYKISPFFSKAGASGDDIIEAIVYLTRYDKSFINQMDEEGIQISEVSKTPGKFRAGIRIETKNLNKSLQSIAGRNDVWLIQPASGYVLYNSNAVKITQSGLAMSGTPIWDKGLHGEGQVIGVMDTGLDYDNAYFAEADKSAPPVILGASGTGSADFSRRKVVAYVMLHTADYGLSATSFDSQGHGTCVCGNALGSKIDDPLSKTINNGMAPMTKLIIQDAGYGSDECGDLPGLGCPVVDLSPFLEQAVRLGANLHNNSYGDRENTYPGNSYTGPTADMDEAVHDNPDFLIICAAGNNGSRGLNSVMSPSIAKNVLCVGAVQSPTLGGSPDLITSFSSIGFAADGRVKPDVTAPGQTITASSDGNITTNNSGTRTISGTSMASPVTAGNVALIRQYFTEGWYPSGEKNPADSITPSAALLKAMIINGADDMTAQSTAPPNRYEGWGRIDLKNTLYFKGGARKVAVIDIKEKFTDTSLTSYKMRFTCTGNISGGKIKITLVWTDFPGSPAAAEALVNDLDLIVQNASDPMEYYMGNNILNTAGLPGYSAEGGTGDRINNVENVILPPETLGEYEIEIKPHRIVYAPQGFALVISGGISPEQTLSAANWTLYN